ncbi:MAG: beta-galactosidase, partial [bacterium]
HAMWKVAYAPGRLEARGFRDGRPVMTQTVETTGPVVRILLTADRARIAADGEDVAVITAAVVDANGRVVPVANDEITFEISGAGRLLGVGNGDPSSHESDRGPRRRAFNGLCAAIVQSAREAGTLRVRAPAGPLGTGTLEITCESATPRPSA